MTDTARLTALCDEFLEDGAIQVATQLEIDGKPEMARCIREARELAHALKQRLQSESATGLSEEDRITVNLMRSLQLDDAATGLDCHALLKIIDRLSTAPLPGGWRPIPTDPCDLNGEYLVYWPAYELDDDGNLTDIPTGKGYRGTCDFINGQVNGEPETLGATGSFFGDDWEYGEPTHYTDLPTPPSQAVADDVQVVLGGELGKTLTRGVLERMARGEDVAMTHNTSGAGEGEG